MRAGESVGAGSCHEACPGNYGPGHRAGLLGPDPHSALRLPGEQRAPPGEHCLPGCHLTSSLPCSRHSLLYLVAASCLRRDGNSVSEKQVCSGLPLPVLNCGTRQGCLS